MMSIPLNGVDAYKAVSDRSRIATALHLACGCERLNSPVCSARNLMTDGVGGVTLNDFTPWREPGGEAGE